MPEQTDSPAPSFNAGQTVRLTLAISGDSFLPVGTTGEVKEVLPDGTLRVLFGEELVAGIQPADVQVV